MFAPCIAVIEKHNIYCFNLRVVCTFGTLTPFLFVTLYRFVEIQGGVGVMKVTVKILS